MGLETGNFISDLNPANPLPADGKDQGDDHIRLLKSALQNSVSGFPGAVLVGGQDTGVSNAYVLASPLRAYSVNLMVFWLPANTNGGASTINIAGLGAQPIRRNDGTPLENGDIMVGNPVAMLYNGTQFRLTAVTKRYVDSLISSGILPGQTGNGGKPLVTDGTNAAFSNAFGVAMDEAEGAPIASASTINLTSAAGTGNFTHITGSSSISTITLPGGAARDLVFDGTPTLVNGANLILPTGANIVVQAGDTLRVRGEGGGVVRVVDYARASGRALAEPTAPGWVLLAPPLVPTAGVSVIDFLSIFSSTYDDYVIVCEGITSTGGLLLQVAINGVVDGANNYSATDFGTTAGSATSGISSNAGAPNNGSAAARFNVLNANASSVGSYHPVFVDGLTGNFPSVGATSRGGYHYNQSAGALSGFRILSGTFSATGTIKVYGIRKAFP